MKKNYRQQTDAELRQKALAVLEKAKRNEAKKKLVPLYIGDENHTVILISPRLSERQREKLRRQKSAQYSKNKITVE